ncbi:MAG TPA: Na-translocating system protein MpsC family protein [Solirubrobacteraceae bacterium]|nr:Na-translocating system protein MpsC family protein [Solirubrobacteraceae bacterium]
MDRSAESVAHSIDGAVRSAISQAIVRIHAERYGKGATQAKTYAWDNVVVTVLADVLTTAERTLVEVSRPDTVRHVRAAFQETNEATFRTAVEAITGRRVRSFMSQVDPATGYGVEVFILEPQTTPGDGAG